METTGTLQSASVNAAYLSALLGAMDPGALSMDVLDSRAELHSALSAMRGSNGELCAVAMEAAFLVAALESATTGLPPHVQEVAGVLLGQLRGVGLMDAYALTCGGFGI